MARCVWSQSPLLRVSSRRGGRGPGSLGKTRLRRSPRYVGAVRGRRRRAVRTGRGALTGREADVTCSTRNVRLQLPRKVPSPEPEPAGRKLRPQGGGALGSPGASWGLSPSVRPQHRQEPGAALPPERPTGSDLAGLRSHGELRFPSLPHGRGAFSRGLQRTKRERGHLSPPFRREIHLVLWLNIALPFF